MLNLALQPYPQIFLLSRKPSHAILHRRVLHATMSVNLDSMDELVTTNSPIAQGFPTFYVASSL